MRAMRSWLPRPGCWSETVRTCIPRIVLPTANQACPSAPRSWVPVELRDSAAERIDHPREVIEAALAHVVPNKVEAAYARSDLFERRRLLMDDWAACLE